MGLTVTYFSGVMRAELQLPPKADSDEHPAPNAFRAFQCYSEYAKQFEGLKDGVWYTAETENSFEAGSYTGYGTWRWDLGILVKAPVYTDVKLVEGPFWELIHFSDCEGMFGTEMSIKLANDFATYQYLADAYPDKWFKVMYDDFRKAFETAARNGAVMFH